MESGLTIGRRAMSAPRATMLTNRSSPASRARAEQGIATTSMSVRRGSASMSEALTMSRPPGTSSGSNLASDGGLRATTLSAASTIGEPMGRSATMTVHEAVPPRISGPYEGIHDTSRPSMTAASREDLPGEQQPLAAEPAEDRRVLHRQTSGAAVAGALRRSTITPSG